MGRAREIVCYASQNLAERERADLALTMLDAIAAICEVEYQVITDLPCAEDLACYQRENHLSHHENESVRADED